MSFPLNLYLGAFGLAFAATLLTLPIWRRICTRFELVDAPGARKIHSQTTPLAGGLAVWTGLCLALFAGWLALKGTMLPVAWQYPLAHGFARRGLEVIAIAIGSGGMLLLGLLDDRYELKPAIKFGGQVVIALITAASGLRITIFVHSELFSFFVTVLWILTVVNAFNFMDNMNGLCSGLGAIGAFCTAIIASQSGQYLNTLLALAVAGALLGFLPHNFPKASAFLGDSGSHLVGYLLAVLVISPHFYSKTNPSQWAVLKPLLLLAVPLFDICSVIIIRWRLGKPFYIGDNNHLSHRLVRHGLSKPRAVLVLLLAAALFGALATF